MSPIQIGLAIATLCLAILAAAASVAHRIGELRATVQQLAKEAGQLGSRLDAVVISTNNHAVVLAAHAERLDSVSRKANWAGEVASKLEGAASQTSSFPIRRTRGSQP